MDATFANHNYTAIYESECGNIILMRKAKMSRQEANEAIRMIDSIRMTGTDRGLVVSCRAHGGKEFPIGEDSPFSLWAGSVCSPSSVEKNTLPAIRGKIPVHWSAGDAASTGGCCSSFLVHIKQNSGAFESICEAARKTPYSFVPRHVCVAGPEIGGSDLLNSCALAQSLSQNQSFKGKTYATSS